MLAVRHVVPARVGREVGVVVDVRDQVPGHAVVEADAAAGALAETHRVLTPLVHVEPVLGGPRHVTGDARRARRPNERHPFGPPRHGEVVGPLQEVEQEHLKPPVEQRGTRDVALAPAGGPQRLVHLDVDEVGPRHGVDQHAADGSEVGTVLERLAQDGVEAFVEIVGVGNDRGYESAPVEVRQPHRHLHRGAGVGPPDLAPAMQLALRIDVVGSRRDGEGERVRRVGGRVQGGVQSHRNLRDGAGLEELQHLDVHGGALERFQDQLDVARGRHDGRVMDAVVRHPGEVPVREPGLEEHVAGGHLVADQRTVRVLALPDEHLVVAHDVHRHPILSRVSGQQMGDGLRARVLGREVQGDAGPEQRSQGLLHPQADIGVPHEGRDAGRRRIGAFQALRDGGLQGAVRRDLQHHTRLKVAPDGLHRRREPHGAADVGPPVVGVQPLRPRPGHRRHERNVGVERTVVQERERRQRVVPERVHGAGVKGDVARQQATLPVAPVKLLHDRPQRRLPAADDGAGRGVLAGDLDPRRRVFPGPEGHLQRIEQILHPRAIEADGQHAARAGDTLLQRGAMEDQACRVRQRERAARVGGRHLAGAVTDHAVGMDAPGPEPFHQGALEHEDDGLGEPDLVERTLRGGEARLAQRDVRVLAPVRLDGVDHAAEHGIDLVKRATATRPLGALTGEHHDDSGLAVIHRRNRRGFLGEGVERLDQRLPAAHREGGADREMGTAAAQVAGQGVQVHVPIPERVPQRLCALRQRARGTRRQGNHESGLRRQRHRPDPWPRRTVLRHHAVPVGPSEPERIDADGHGAIGERLALRLHLHGAALEVDLRVRHQEAPRDRRERAPLDHQEHLEQRAVERGGLHVPHVALHAGKPQRNGSAASAERLRDRVALDAVAHHGAGRMGFDVVEVPRRPPRAGAGRAHQLDLRVPGGCGDVAPLGEAAGAVGGAGRIERGSLHHGANRVSVPLRRLEWLDREREGPFGTHVSVRFRVERVTLAVGADDPQGIERGAQPGGSQVVDGPHDGLLAIPAPERVDGRVQGGEACGARRAVRDRRPHQVEVVGDAIGQHRHTDVRHVERTGAVHRSPVRHRRHLRADEDSRGAVAQRTQVPAGALEGLPRAGQEHPDLRVHHHHFVLGHPEQGAIEAHLPVLADQPFPGAREPARTGESANRPVSPAVPVGDRLLDNLAVAEQAPEVVVGADAARHAVAVSRDGDFHAGIRCVHFRCVLSAASSTPGQRVNPLCTRAGRAFDSLPQSWIRPGPIDGRHAATAGCPDETCIPPADRHIQYRFALDAIGNSHSGGTRQEEAPCMPCRSEAQPRQAFSGTGVGGGRDRGAESSVRRVPRV